MHTHTNSYIATTVHYLLLFITLFSFIQQTKATESTFNITIDTINIDSITIIDLEYSHIPSLNQPALPDTLYDVVVKFTLSDSLQYVKKISINLLKQGEVNAVTLHQININAISLLPSNLPNGAYYKKYANEQVEVKMGSYYQSQLPLQKIAFEIEIENADEKKLPKIKYKK